MRSTESTIENRIQTCSRFNSLTFLHIMYIIYTAYTYVKSWHWKGPPSALKHAWFWMNWNIWTLFLISYRAFHIISSLYKFTEWKSSVLNCTAYSQTKEMYVTLCHAGDDRTGNEEVMQLLLNFLAISQQEFEQNLIICSTGFKHVRV